MASIRGSDIFRLVTEPEVINKLTDVIVTGIKISTVNNLFVPGIEDRGNFSSTISGSKPVPDESENMIRV